MQALALLPVTVSDGLRLLLGASKKLIVGIIFLVRCWGVPLALSLRICRAPAISLLLWGAFHVEGGLGCFGVPVEPDFVGALLFKTLEPLIF